MLAFLSNVFYDTSSPWYYVIGVLFLLLIFGALALYIIWSGKKNKHNEKQNENKTDAAEAGEGETAADNTDNAATPQEQEKE